MEEKERYLDLPLEEVLGDRFGRYSKYIIQDRALPDARDGLKPVQRRILYAMHVDKNTADKPFRKSAKTVGNVIGNYHPHGDSSVYEAMIRQSQDWKMRHLLVQMHGNNGSIDGDPPAAMRYTEARLSKIASEILQDIEKDTVDFMPNFDDSQEEPVVMPASYPNLLVNGSTGISSGYATDIPPHHLGEVIDAAIHQMTAPDCTVDDLMQHIKGPDFPTGGIIQGIEGLRKAYETGKGKIVLRGKVSIETVRSGREQLIITEIPYEVNKANLVKKMDELRLDKKVDGIAEVRDDTDRTGLRIVVELKKDADAQGILHFLYKNTDLQVSYNFNMVAIYNKTPKLLGIKEMLDAYIQHQKQVVTRRTRFDLNKAKTRAHIVEGLIKAISILDDVIATIRESKDKGHAKEQLQQRYQFSEPQSEAIVNLQLYRLTNTDITTLEQEAKELQDTIEKLESILATDQNLISEIKKELRRIKKTYSENRRTMIEEEIEDLKINLEVVVPSEDVRVTVTREGYVKRSSIRSYTASNGEPPGMKESDRLLCSMEMNTTDTLLLFTKKGSYLYLPVHVLPENRWKDNGQHVANIVSMDNEDEIINAIPVKEFTDERYLMFATKNGMIKRSVLSDYKAQRHSKALMAVKLKKDDDLIYVSLTDGDQDIFISTHLGYGLWFSEEEVGVTGQRTAGVKAINLKPDDKVMSCQSFTLEEKPAILLITQRAAYKKMSLNAFEKTSRAKRGVVMLKELKKSPHRVYNVFLVQPTDKIHVEASDGSHETIDPSLVRQNDRYTNGSFLFDVSVSGDITDAWLEKSDATPVAIDLTHT
ncbi:DNA topoisomerase IV subunit A [Salipaludibacillus agaradhaerens]|uniref:DNA topoisomerase 4 subunit A n=1 Tax=Salipaludibacillus agaradhaerens TaxID=76935 RepID=A0A9Q4FYI5_SALAG|nr:DNA topoisomerase IV subunit A [Salipaludibacillus agaradhaerens]MCR6096391.1 DNA topoisomerase IV subunit A [Salipaludibacillus agaradhaerens]MCR6114050.1 DNA topoisomerase IV subunit A [Salipaludibacillus agaradhaerens]